MANEAYANGRELSRKVGLREIDSVVPRRRFTPPQAPPTPLGVPVPP